jgi:hypothetical protein
MYYIEAIRAHISIICILSSCIWHLFIVTIHCSLSYSVGDSVGERHVAFSVKNATMRSTSSIPIGFINAHFIEAARGASKTFPRQDRSPFAN